MLRSATHFALVGMLVFGASANAVLAQDNPPAPPDGASQGVPPPGMHGRHGMQDPAKQLEHMTAKLNLTAAQQSQIRPILADHDQQLQALRADTTLSREDKMGKMKGIHEDFDGKVQAVLNDQQKQKWAALKQEQRAKMQEHMKDHQGGMDHDGPPPAQ